MSIVSGEGGLQKIGHHPINKITLYTMNGCDAYGYKCRCQAFSDLVDNEIGNQVYWVQDKKNK